MRTLSYDIGGTDIKYGIVENGIVIKKGKVATLICNGFDYFKKQLLDIANELLKEYKVDGVGVSCAGSINIDTGVTLVASPNLKGMEGFNFYKFFEENLNLSCIVDNDVNSFGVAESNNGAGKEFQQFLVMTVGTGIGGAIINNDEVWRGKHFSGGEFGRMFLSDGVNYETKASVKSLIQFAQKAGLKINNGIDIFNLYDNSNPIAIKVVNEFFHNLALGIANLVYIFNPEAIIVGGGVANRKTFSDEIKVALKDILEPFFYESVQIKNSIHGNDGGLIGAYYNFVHYKERKNL